MRLPPQRIVPLCLGRLKRQLHGFDRPFVDQRSDQNAFLPGIADPKTRVGAFESLNHRIDQGLVDDQPPRRRATLSGGAYGGKEDAAEREFQVGRGGHDDRVVPAQLEERSPHPAGDSLGNADPIRQLPVAEISGSLTSRIMLSPTSSAPPTAKLKTPSQPFAAATSWTSFCTAIAVNGVSGEGFRIMESPQTAASAAFQAQTATGKLNAVMIPTGPSGCHCSIMRCSGRSLATRQTVKLTRQADSKVAHVDHLLNFPFLLRPNLAGFQRHEQSQVPLSCTQRAAS